MARQNQTLGWIWPKDPRPGNPSSWPRRWRLRDVLTNKGPDIYVGVIGQKTKSPSSASTSRSSSVARGLTPSTTPSSTPSARTRRSHRTNWDRWDHEPTPFESISNANSAAWGPSAGSTSGSAGSSTAPVAAPVSISNRSSRSKSKPKIELPWARRGDGERYDYRQRKYTVPDMGTWSRVEYCAGRGEGSEKHYVPRRYWDRNGNEYPANYWHDIIYGEHDDHDVGDEESNGSTSTW
ncbi:hypothetical protein N7466_005091 [Penicillium verhagenii]|uniref:uncharacterized protein n=1 Tax=Penicillium verhagenii TaxID=1562060 RepID=UPI0025456960|nr:uncharacterized protein N7466_005091 [Penicillium verhagenii]KAJ5935544.1 hypothetical protein N7466_005091 [Penicillium verhagenii]